MTHAAPPPPDALHGLPDYLRPAVERIQAFDAQPLPMESAWYGLGALLNDWLGLPPALPVYCSLYHGLKIGPHVQPFYQRTVLPILVQRREQLHRLTAHYRRVAINSGLPHVHFRRQHAITIAPDARGTIAIPAHSTHHVDLKMDFTAYAVELLTLPERYQPVSVCLYWKDLLTGGWRPFIKRGIPVFTAGHMFDPLFVPGLYRILAAHRYATGNDISTGAVCANEMGLPFFLSGPDARYINRSGEPNQIRTEPGAEFGNNTPDHIPEIRALYAAAPRHDEAVGLDTPFAAMLNALHGCDEPIDRDTLRLLILSQYLRHAPGAQAFYDHLKANPGLFELL